MRRPPFMFWSMLLLLALSGYGCRRRPVQATQEVNAGTLIGYEVQIDKGDIIGIAKDIVVNTTSGGIDYVIIRN